MRQSEHRRHRAIPGVVAALSFAVAATAACGRGRIRGPDVATTTSAEVTTGESAVHRITATMCDREVACNHVGPHESYPTREGCLSELEHDDEIALGAQHCPGGISEPDLNDCLHDIRVERCGNPLDFIRRLAACRKDKLCLRL